MSHFASGLPRDLIVIAVEGRITLMKKSMQVVAGVPTLGKRITEARLAFALKRRKEFPQTELADKVGVSDATVGRWERGAKYPELQRIPLIAQALECDAGWLTFGPPDPDAYAGDERRAEEPPPPPSSSQTTPSGGSGGGRVPARPPRGRRPRKPLATEERHHALPPMWYGDDALAVDVEERRA